MSPEIPPSPPINDCGCCEGISASTPLEIENRPGLAALAYRVGTHPQFKESMLAGLSDSAYPALRALTSRSDSDFSIALLDAWAVVADVLTFYQERIANESYLRTSTERFSVLELARLIDYQLRPGVAASAYLAFTVEDAPGAFGQALVLGTSLPGVPETPPAVTLDIGVKVQSVPGPGETAQTYETVEKIEARAEWNGIKPRLTERHPIARDASQLYFEGLATSLRPGDGLILFPDDDSEAVLRRVASVAAEASNNRTLVKMEPLPTITASFASGSGFSLGTTSATLGGLASHSGALLHTTLPQADLQVFALTNRFEVADLFRNLVALRQPPPSVFALRNRAAIFGHNAPLFDALPATLRFGEVYRVPSGESFVEQFAPGVYAGRTWVDNLNLGNYPGVSANSILLDSSYPGMVKDSFVVLQNGSTARVYQVAAATDLSKSDFTLSAKATQLTLTPAQDFNLFTVRGTAVFGQSELLSLSRLPIETVVEGRIIELDGFVGNLFEGQKLIICGEQADLVGVRICELAAIEIVEQILEVEGFTRITLEKNLVNQYIRNTVTINGNVALATHGETVQEVMGGGDAIQAFQRFVLRQPPLTYVSSESASGADTTLSVRVNELLWEEEPSLFGHGGDERVYITRLDDDGNTTVIFGDGRSGARVPTGSSNITAKYRKGIGLAGLVKADQLSQLLVRPLGVKGVTNPMAASGAQDPEQLSDAKRNAPLTVLTLGRAVSLRDYEDFARAFAGIGKASATWTWNGETRGVVVTVAGSGGEDIPEDSPLLDNLRKALIENGDPKVPLTIVPSAPLFFRVSANVKIDPAYEAATVLAAIEAKLRDAFSFEAREFGQPVMLSEVIAIMQNVRGVIALDVDELYRVRDDPPGSLIRGLAAAAPRPGATAIVPAELLILDPRPVDLGVLP